MFNDRKEYWVKGIVADKVQPDRKQSTDLYVNKNDSTKPLFSYRTQLQWCLEQYVKIYPELEIGGRFNINGNYNIQHYNVNEGFTYYHCERSLISSCLRNLVFMTYLNDVEEGGETEFLYQQLKVKPKKGTVVIWPGSFTHLHRGNPPMSDKYIATGWWQGNIGLKQVNTAGMLDKQYMESLNS